MSLPEPGEPKKNRFTFVHVLVLLIVVNALIALLLMPNVNPATGKGRRATCLNNLKQIGLAMRLYAGDYGGMYPTDPLQTTVGSFALLTNTYMTAYKTWVCPSDSSRRLGSDSVPFTSTNLSYAYGAFDLSEAVQSDTPLASDRSVGNIRSAKPWASSKNNHQGDGGNILFADGHVEFRKKLDVPMYRGKNP